MNNFIKEFKETNKLYPNNFTLKKDIKNNTVEILIKNSNDYLILDFARVPTFNIVFSSKNQIVLNVRLKFSMNLTPEILHQISSRIKEPQRIVMVVHIENIDIPFELKDFTMLNHTQYSFNDCNIISIDNAIVSKLGDTGVKISFSNLTEKSYNVHAVESQVIFKNIIFDNIGELNDECRFIQFDGCEFKKFDISVSKRKTNKIYLEFNNCELNITQLDLSMLDLSGISSLTFADTHIEKVINSNQKAYGTIFRNCNIQSFDDNNTVRNFASTQLILADNKIYTEISNFGKCVDIRNSLIKGYEDLYEFLDFLKSMSEKSYYEVVKIGSNIFVRGTYGEKRNLKYVGKTKLNRNLNFTIRGIESVYDKCSSTDIRELKLDKFVNIITFQTQIDINKKEIDVTANKTKILINNEYFIETSLVSTSEFENVTKKDDIFDFYNPIEQLVQQSYLKDKYPIFIQNINLDLFDKSSGRIEMSLSDKENAFLSSDYECTIYSMGQVSPFNKSNFGISFTKAIAIFKPKFRQLDVLTMLECSIY